MTEQTLSKALSPDQLAAHAFLTELRTRITTQPLPYQHGVESTALESLWKVFDQAREAIKKNPGCQEFAATATEMLNVTLRPFTAKWHRAYEEGRLKSRDGADEFRSELKELQAKLREFAAKMHEMAYGRAERDKLTPPALPAEELKRCFEDLPFGIAPGSSVSTNDCAKINEHEAQEVAARRMNQNASGTSGANATGLALSGGGIRSATFCLGVVQVLAEKTLLKEVDFLSTVSGGGYTGSFLTRRLGEGAAQAEVAGPRGPDPEPIRYLRQNAKFLVARTLKESWSMVTATLAGMLLNWAAPFLVLVVAAIVAVNLREPLSHAPWLLILGGGGAVSILALLIYGWALRKGRKATKTTGGVLGTCLAITILIAVIWGLKAGYDCFHDGVHSEWSFSKGTAAVVAAVASVAPAMIRFLPILKNSRVRKLVVAVCLWLAAFILPLLAILVFYLLCAVGEMSFPPAVNGAVPSHQVTGLAILWGIAALLALIDFFLLNINVTAPHRLYRDGLAKTFVQKETSEDDLPLTTINPNQTAPYHLLNATLNVPSSTDPAVRDRRCDFFMFSKHWSGSPGTGYFPTSQWQTNGQPADLASAMAISGAAVSSYMGLGSMPTLTALLTFMNVRLGFWIKNPAKSSGSPHPGFLCLLREMLGVAMSEKKRWLNLSDGGHIENMAVYELLRRRCKFIICVDGEADSAFGFQGLMTLVRHAQIDFGVRIEPALDGLRPNATTGLSQTHAHFCRIHYADPKGIGLLLYLKLSVTGNETELIKRYRTNHPDFPHQSTLDQFFDQEQFEAYRQLGVHVAEGLFSPALMSETEASQAVDPTASADPTRPGTIRAWFARLGGNLLDPERA
ncbi:MAG: hypothetical protein QOC70_210 [Verrucomicrobiota bacterium]|jgi:predicted acylesterase/phospholipase RssA